MEGSKAKHMEVSVIPERGRSMASRAGGFVTNRSFVGLFYRFLEAARYRASAPPFYLLSVIILTTVCGCISSFAQVQAFPNQDGTQVAVHTLRGKAKPDECFAYMSSPSPLPTFS